MKNMDQISSILKDYTHHGVELPLDIPLLKKIEEKIAIGNKLVFLLPAFPAKSPSPEKTAGELPDMGEVLALQNLQGIAGNLTKLVRASLMGKPAFYWTKFPWFVQDASEVVDYHLVPVD